MSHTPLPATAPAQPPDPAGLIASGRRVLPTCAFVASYIQRHPEYRDLLA